MVVDPDPTGTNIVTLLVASSSNFLGHTLDHVLTWQPRQILVLNVQRPYSTREEMAFVNSHGSLHGHRINGPPQAGL
jgi:hypothetical protein